MYICESCNHLFISSEFEEYEENHGETFSCCPNCGSYEWDEAVYCPECFKYTSVSKFEHGMCENCRNEIEEEIFNFCATLEPSKRDYIRQMVYDGDFEIAKEKLFLKEA